MTSPFPTPFPYQGASSCPGRHLGHPGPHGKGSLQRPSLTCVPPKNPLSRARCSARQRPWSCSWSSSSAHKPAPLMDNKVCPVATSGQLVTTAPCLQVSRGPRSRTHHRKTLSSCLPAERPRAPILHASLCPHRPGLSAGSSLRFPPGPGLSDSSDGFHAPSSSCPRTQGAEPRTQSVRDNCPFALAAVASFAEPAWGWQGVRGWTAKAVGGVASVV